MNKLETHADWNAAYIKSVRAYRASRNFEMARYVLGHLRLIRKLQIQCGV